LFPAYVEAAAGDRPRRPTRGTRPTRARRQDRCAPFPTGQPPALSSLSQTRRGDLRVSTADPSPQTAPPRSNGTFGVLDPRRPQFEPQLRVARSDQRTTRGAGGAGNLRGHLAAFPARGAQDLAAVAHDLDEADGTVGLLPPGPRGPVVGAGTGETLAMRPEPRSHYVLAPTLASLACGYALTLLPEWVREQ